MTLHKRMNGMQVLYSVIALATALHTAFGASYVLQGPQPVATGPAVLWMLQGLFYAIAIDVGMYVLSNAIRIHTQRQAVSIGRIRFSFSWYVITFGLVALLSAYFQIVYAWIHAQPIPVNTSVSVYWQNAISPLVDARIVIVPLALPAIAILYALGGLGKQGTTKKEAKEPSPRVASPSAVSVSRPKLETPHLPVQRDQDVLPAPKTLAAQRVVEHLERHPEHRSLSVRKLAAVLDMPPATVYKATRKYRDEQGPVEGP